MNTKHHTSLPIAKQLAEAGIVIESDYVWCHGDLIPVINVILETTKSDILPAPIATELLERLPFAIDNGYLTIDKSKDCYHVSYEISEDKNFLHFSAENLLDSLALLLIRLKQDGLI